jgi:hypothetical protein
MWDLSRYEWQDLIVIRDSLAKLDKYGLVDEDLKHEVNKEINEIELSSQCKQNSRSLPLIWF